MNVEDRVTALEKRLTNIEASLAQLAAEQKRHGRILLGDPDTKSDPILDRIEHLLGRLETLEVRWQRVTWTTLGYVTAAGGAGGVMAVLLKALGL